MPLRSSTSKLRLVNACILIATTASALVVACSDKARLPSEVPNTRIYQEDLDAGCEETSLPARPGGDTFAELYADVFSLKGVAKCQTPTCHGNDTGPGGNGMAMYPPTVPTTKPPTSGKPGLADDRGLYCGLTSHMVAQGVSTKVASPCRGDAGTDCTCRHGDDCVCGLGPNAGKKCCNPKTDDDTSCKVDPTECDKFCRKLMVSPHTDPKNLDATVDSEILRILSPTKDGEPAFMPNPLSCGRNRKLLPEELARIESWLKRGAPYDGTAAVPLAQPAYVCPPPVIPAE